MLFYTVGFDTGGSLNFIQKKTFFFTNSHIFHFEVLIVSGYCMSISGGMLCMLGDCQFLLFRHPNEGRRQDSGFRPGTTVYCKRKMTNRSKN